MNRPAVRLFSLALLCTALPALPSLAETAKPAAADDVLCRGIEPNGPDLTGIAMRRQPPKCPPVERFQVEAVNLDAGVTLADGKTVKKVVLIGSELTVDGKPLPSPTGAVLQAVAEQSRPLKLRIEKAAPAPDPKVQTPVNEDADVMLYSLSYQWSDFAGDTNPWRPLCGGDNQAVLIAGRWNYESGQPGNGGKRPGSSQQVTVACLGSAIAKCVAFGYKPWRAVPPATAAKAGAKATLDELHQACVRAVRADYCGDGTSLTRPGARVNFYDTLAVMTDDVDWPLEAEWTAAGARCVAATRLSMAPKDPRANRAADIAPRDYITAHCPRLPFGAACTRSKDAGARLITEAQPQ